MKRIVLILLAMKCFFGISQSVNITLDEDYYHQIERYEIKWGYLSSSFFTTIKPYKRNTVINFVDSLHKTNYVFTSRSDRFNYTYFRNNNWEWSHAHTNTSKKAIFKYLYRKKSDFFHVDISEFDLHVNPVLYLDIGIDSRLNYPSYINTRGVEIRGMIDKKIGFYTFLADNQSILPSYIHDVLTAKSVIPHEGFWKLYKDNGVDFFQVRAYVDFNITKHIYMQFGHDRTFIGNGYRSLILSDHAPPSLFLRTNLKIWKINYLFQLNYLVADVRSSSTGSLGNIKYPGKFIATHHASFTIGKRFNFGVFESVVFGQDSASVGGHIFNISYLNPVIFYRAIEQQFGSSDNVIIGMDFKWNIVQYFSFYGQFIIDELLVEEAINGRGWWGNKFGAQLGIKYIDVVGIQNLDLQLEVNAVRPYTYSHHTNYGSYTHYRQSLAHPLGANFYEIVGIIRYQPIPKLNLVMKMFYAQQGKDTTGVNWGGDILKNNTLRQRDFSNFIGQGIVNELCYINFRVSYMIKHNFYIDIRYTTRMSRGLLPLYHNTTHAMGVTLRWNISKRTYDF